MIIETFRHTAQNSRVIHIGRCIYCRDINTNGLTREHVIPDALGGGLVLRAASCDYHRELINKGFESKILDDWFGPLRLAIKLKDPKNTRRRFFPVSLRHGATWKDTSVAMKEFPLS